ncbi:MAG: ABC transporter ATP-binding protein [Thermomicrobiales bacterium]
MRKAYGDVVAVRALTLSVRQGEVFGFLGPNGAGKSTTVKMLTGLIRPSSGEARLLGRRLGTGKRSARPATCRRCSASTTGTANEFLDVHGRLAMPAAEQRAFRKRWISSGSPDAVTIACAPSRKGCSSARVAQALIHRPRLIFLDEPTSALDPIGRRIVRDVIRDLRDQGTTVFLNSHLLSEVEMVSDRVAILNRGVVVAAGRLDELRQQGISVEMKVGGWNDRLQARRGSRHGRGASNRRIRPSCPERPAGVGGADPLDSSRCWRRLAARSTK